MYYIFILSAVYSKASLLMYMHSRYVEYAHATVYVERFCESQFELGY